MLKFPASKHWIKGFESMQMRFLFLDSHMGLSRSLMSKCIYTFPFMNQKTTNSITPARTRSISGLKSRVLNLSFLSLKMMVKSGLEFILKFTEPLQSYLLSCQANSAILGRYFCTGRPSTLKGSDSDNDRSRT